MLNKKHTKFLVLYVFSKYDNIDRLKEFVKSYKKYNLGYPHDLLICYKLLDNEKLQICRKITSDIKHQEFIDLHKINDFEFKSMERAIKQYKDYLILFLISHCCFEKDNTLKIINDHYKENSFIGFSGSNESMFSSLKFKKIWKIFKYLKEYFFFRENFNKFPNPHIRLPSFVLKQEDFLEFVADKSYFNKKDAWITESGKSSMTNFFLKLKYNVFIINFNGKKFDLLEMKHSMTFCNDKSNDILISDRHTRNFKSLSQILKDEMTKRVWG